MRGTTKTSKACLVRYGVIAALCLAAAPVSAIDYSNWHTPAQIDALFKQFETDHPGLAKVYTIGTTHEGKPIKVLKISDNVASSEPAEGDVVFIAAHHAREWISVEMALYLADQLLQRYGTDTQLHADMDNLEIWILPVANPDGYEYSAAPGGNRYWRKNRRPNADGTFGVDLNRNWGYEWGHYDGYYTSSTPNHDTYAGTGPFSESETVTMRNFINGLDNFKTLLTYHSYSELFLRPWGFSTADAPGEKTLRALAQRSIAAISAVHGKTYGETLWYVASGEATDYMWGVTRTSAFTPELRPSGDLGLPGFNPPTSTILPTSEENLPAALALIHDAGAREVWIRDYPGDTGQEPSAVWTGTNWSAAFWVSPDISTNPATLTEGATVNLSVQVHNNTGQPRHNVTVDIYYTDPRISLEFPNPNAVLIASQTVTVPPPGKTITVPWTVPTGANSWGEYHWCVGAVIMHDSDLPLTTQAQRTSNIAIRNFQTEEVHSDTTLIVAATNFLDEAAELLVSVDDHTLPAGWRALLPRFPARRAERPTTSIERKAKLLEAKGPLLEPGETIYIPLRVTAPDGAPAGQTAEVNVHGALIPLVAGKREAVGNGYTYRVTKGP